MTKRIPVLALTLTGLISFGGIAKAEIFAAGPAYGGNIADNFSGVVTCRVFNAGLTAVSISNTQIFTNTNAALSLFANTCIAGPLGVAKYCAFSAIIPGNFAYSCRVIATGTDDRLTGEVDVVGGSGQMLNAQPLK